MKQGYAFQKFEKEKMARALGKDLPISKKHAAMVCNAIRGKSVERARTILNESIELKKAIPFTKYNRDKGHKSKIGPGRYVPKTCSEILKVLNSAESNGHQKNLGSMHVVHICVQNASKPWHFGRWRRRQMKRSHIEVVVAEKSDKKTAAKEKTEEKKEAKNVEKIEKAEKTGEAKESR